MNSAIYEIVNRETNQRYIGSSKEIDKRQYMHFWQLSTNTHINCLLQNSYNEYGPAAFNFNVLEYVEEERLKEVEQFYLDRTSDKFNINKYAASGGYDMDRHPNGEVIRQKLRETSTGRVKSEETREKLRLLATGRVFDDATKLKMSASRKGRFSGEHSPHFKGYYVVPGGKHPTLAEAASAVGISNALMFKIMRDVDTVIVKKSYRNCPYLNTNFDSSVIGQTWRSLGFSFEPK